MKAYIKTQYEGGRGPHAHSHRTQISTQETAVVRREVHAVEEPHQEIAP